LNNDRKESSNTISLEKLKELKDKGITTENFLQHLVNKQKKLLHGSAYQIDEEVRSSNGKIFATNNSAIAILKSLYSNVGVNLVYPYFINDDNPLILNIDSKKQVEKAEKERGFVYVLDQKGFENNPKGSWQFIKKESSVKFKTIIEIEKNDFKYPVQIKK